VGEISDMKTEHAVEKAASKQVLVAQALLPVWVLLDLYKSTQARVPVPHDFSSDFEARLSRSVPNAKVIPKRSHAFCFTPN
jgi:hypothetical protein